MVASNTYHTLEDWLSWQQTLHAREIELGLDRIKTVAQRLNLLDYPYKVVVVAGTNGKGSTVTLLSTILHHAGYKVGTYTSPHIIRYNERIRIGLRCVQDQQLCDAFQRINDARAGISLSFFEFGTLTALDLFKNNAVDVAVMEIGLGGRLDAVNILDGDLTFVTSIGLDHTEWLGDDRESIGQEKAGVFRAGVPAICGDPNPPRSLIRVATDVGAKLYRLGPDYGFEVAHSSWSFHARDWHLTGLPLPNLAGAIQIRNASNVLMGLHAARECLPVTRGAIESGLRDVTLEGRFQRILKHCEIILDVAHNAESAQVLAENLSALPKPIKTHAVFSVLSDKDIEGILQAMSGHIDRWYIAQVHSPRAMDLDKVMRVLSAVCTEPDILRFNTVEEAYNKAQSEALSGDRILVFGSIFTVSEVLSSES